MAPLSKGDEMAGS